MESSFYDIAYVGHQRAFVSYFDADTPETVIELTPEQLERVWDFNAKQSDERTRFLRELVSEA